MISTIIGCFALIGFIAAQVAFNFHPLERSAQWSIASAIYLLIAAICFK